MMTNKDDFILAEQYIEWRDNGIPLSYEKRKYVENTPDFDPDKIVKEHIQKAKPKRKVKPEKQTDAMLGKSQMEINAEFNRLVQQNRKRLIEQINEFHLKYHVPATIIQNSTSRTKQWLKKYGAEL